MVLLHMIAKLCIGLPSTPVSSFIRFSVFASNIAVSSFTLYFDIHLHPILALRGTFCVTFHCWIITIWNINSLGLYMHYIFCIRCRALWILYSCWMMGVQPKTKHKHWLVFIIFSAPKLRVQLHHMWKLLLEIMFLLMFFCQRKTSWWN